MSSPRLVAIHQPNFFPWLGYFDKIARADVFIVLDHVQFPKSEGNWSNRVRMLVNGTSAWVTMPVVRSYQGLRRIDEMRIDNGKPWRRKLLQLLRTNYGRAACFTEVFAEMSTLVEQPAERLVDYNLNAVTTIAARLGLSTAHIVRSSTLAVDAHATDLIIALVKRAGGTAYLTGGGAAGYQDDEAIRAAGLDVQYQNFEPPVYEQRGSERFVPGLSILDALFNCGFDRTARLLYADRRHGAPA